MKKDYQDWKEAINRELGSLIDYELNSMDMGMLNIDLNWEEYGLPKANENKDYNLPRYIKGSGRKPSSRAKRRQQTKKHKKKNIRIAKAKGYDLEKCSACEKSGNVSVLSDRYSNRNHDSIRGTWLFEGKNKTIALSKEIKDYPNDIIDWDEFWLGEYWEACFSEDFFKDDELFYITTSDKGSGYTHKRKATEIGTSVKEVLFDYILSNELNDSEKELYLKYIKEHWKTPICR